MNQNLQNQVNLQPSLFKRAQEMAQDKTTPELEQIARNICESKGINFEDALKQFKSMWRI